jgi:hypothetical protein
MLSIHNQFTTAVNPVGALGPYWNAPISQQDCVPRAAQVPGGRGATGFVLPILVSFANDAIEPTAKLVRFRPC